MMIIKKTRNFTNERSAEIWIADLESKFNIFSVSIEQIGENETFPAGTSPVKATVEYRKK